MPRFEPESSRIRSNRAFNYATTTVLLGICRESCPISLLIIIQALLVLVVVWSWLHDQSIVRSAVATIVYLNVTKLTYLIHIKWGHLCSWTLVLYFSIEAFNVQSFVRSMQWPILSMIYDRNLRLAVKLHKLQL